MCATYDRLSIHGVFVNPLGRGVRATRLRTLVDGPYRDDEAAGVSFMHELFSGMALALGIALHSKVQLDAFGSTWHRHHVANRASTQPSI